MATSKKAVGPKLSATQQFKLDMEALSVKREEQEGQKQYKVAIKEVEKLRAEMERLLSVTGVKHTHAIPPKKRKDCRCTHLCRIIIWTKSKQTPKMQSVSVKYRCHAYHHL